MSSSTDQSAGAAWSTAAGPGRQRLYCVVPVDLAGSVAQLLRASYSAAGVRIVVERRADRGGASGAAGEAVPRAERPARAERRRPVTVPVEAPPLPVGVRRYRSRLTFVRVSRDELAEFDRLYTSCHGALQRYLGYALGGSGEAEDLAQTVLANAYAALARGERPESLEAWLFTIARNELLKHIDKHARVSVVDTGELQRLREGHRAAEPPTLGWLTQRPLIAHFDRLSRREQQILTLAHVFDLPDGRIALLCDSTPSAVAKAKSLAHRKLRTTLTAGGERGQRAAFGSSRLATPVRSRRVRSISVLPRLSPRVSVWSTPPPRF